jgi:hypothetical protein
VSDLPRAVIAAQATTRVAAAAVPARERTWVSPAGAVQEWLHRIGRDVSVTIRAL